MAAGALLCARAAGVSRDNAAGPPSGPPGNVPSRLRQTRVTPLAITHEHALRVGDLPAHHRDPFDRLLVAQAQFEKLPLLTADEALAKYDIEIVRAAG